MRIAQIFLLIILSFSLTSNLYSQKPKRLTSSEIQMEIKKLNNLGTVLYVAAHPDDENTRLIGYLSQGELIETAYLSITRGDGGQNLIGPEIRERLGIIRTQELLQARATDGSRQFFSRANDFGYSKNPEETLSIWDKEDVLGDMVWVIRNYKPDILITRFPPDSRAGHGHHTSSAILAHEAFNLAGDPESYPEQLTQVDVWQPKSIYWNTHPWFFQNGEFDKTGMVEINVGGYNPFIGKSYTEVAAESRSMHKSQGFGSTGTRGDQLEYLAYVDGDSIPGELFSNVDISWARIEGGEEIGELLSGAYKNYDPENPSQVVPELMKAYDLMIKHKEDPRVSRKIDDLVKVITSSMGLFAEVTTNHYSVSPGDSVTFKVEVINRSSIPVKILSFNEEANENSSSGSFLNFNQPFNTEFKIRISEEKEVSQPYWLRSEGTLGMFKVDDQSLIGRPENHSAYSFDVSMEIDGVPFTYTTNAVYKRNDPVDGEVYRPFVITPPVYVNLGENTHVFANGASKDIEVIVKAGRNDLSGEISVNLPKGWKAEPESIRFNLDNKDEEKSFSVEVFPPKKQSEGHIEFIATVDGVEYDQGLVSIEYDHIPTQTLFPKAKAKVVKVQLEKKGNRVGYIMGAGDDIPASLRQIGYEVDLLEDGDITSDNLKAYDAVIVGIRAYNTQNHLKFDQSTLMDYVKNGGTMIVQYNTSRRLIMEDFAPYPIELTRARVSDETAEVRILEPEHPVMNSPNKIGPADFENWVQERGLYFPGEWDENYTPILSSNDAGEEPRNGGLLVASYGEGYYIYSGYSWFRELPAGVPGAFRIFTNLISIGK